MIALPFAGGFPIDEVEGQFFPVAAALDGDVADTVADDLVFADELVGAVFEDKAMVGAGVGQVRLEGERLLLRLLRRD